MAPIYCYVFIEAFECTFNLGKVHHDMQKLFRAGFYGHQKTGDERRREIGIVTLP